MSLSLTLYPNTVNDDFYVDDVRVQAFARVTTSEYKVKVFTAGMIRVYQVRIDSIIEILPDVRVSSYVRDLDNNKNVRIVIDAPRTIIILRGKHYRASHLE